jgi:curved DNA-binding protein
VLRLKGKGYPGVGGSEPGDLLLTVTIEPHETFELKGDDLMAELPVDFYTAALGGKIAFQALKGQVHVPVPEGTQAGTILRLKGLGMPLQDDNTKYGNLLLKVKIILPETITPEERHLLQQARRVRGS